MVGPEQVDDAFPTDRAVDGQEREQRADPSSSQFGRSDGGAVERHLQRPEDRDLELPRRHRGQAGEEVGRGAADLLAGRHEATQLGARRLRDLVHQPLRQTSTVGVSVRM